MVADRPHRSGFLSDCLHRGHSCCRHPSPVPGLEDASPPRPRLPSRDTACEPRWTRADARPRPAQQLQAPGPARTAKQLRDHRRGIAHAQQSGFAIVNLFTTYTPLSRFHDAVGAEIIYVVLSHIAELDKFASTTVSGAATDTDCTLAIRVISTEADALAQRPMGKIRALAESQGGTMDTNAQAGTWTLSVHLPLGESPPA